MVAVLWVGLWILGALCGWALCRASGLADQAREKQEEDEDGS